MPAVGQPSPGAAWVPDVLAPAGHVKTRWLANTPGSWPGLRTCLSPPALSPLGLPTESLWLITVPQPQRAPGGRGKRCAGTRPRRTCCHGRRAGAGQGSPWRQQPPGRVKGGSGAFHPGPRCVNTYRSERRARGLASPAGGESSRPAPKEGHPQPCTQACTCNHRHEPAGVTRERHGATTAALFAGFGASSAGDRGSLAEHICQPGVRALRRGPAPPCETGLPSWRAAAAQPQCLRRAAAHGSLAIPSTRSDGQAGV